jgi:hypothetical protein
MTYISALFAWKDEIGRLCSSANQVARRDVEACCYSIDCSKAGTLNSAFQVANERAIKPSLHVEFHLRHAEIFPHRSHYFSERSFHASARLNLFSTVGHQQGNPELLSAIGQRVVTDNRKVNELAEGRP